MSQQYPYVESQGLYFPKHILEKWTLQKGGKREPTLAFWEKWAHSRFLCGGQRGHEPRGASPPIGRINSSQPTGLPVLCGLARLKNISSVNQILCRELEIGNTERTAKLAMGTEAETSWYSEGPEKLRRVTDKLKIQVNRSWESEKEVHLPREKKRMFRDERTKWFIKEGQRAVPRVDLVL